MSFHTQTVSFQVERQFPAVLFHRATTGTQVEAGTLSNQFSQRQDVVTHCVGEVIVIRPHLLGESAQGILLLILREVEGQEEVLEDKDEEEKEIEVDEKVKEVRENAQLMHATW